MTLKSMLQWKLLVTLFSAGLSACAVIPGMRVSSTDGASSIGPAPGPMGGKLYQAQTSSGKFHYRLVDLDGAALTRLASIPVARPSYEGLTAEMVASQPEDYRVGPGDILQVTVWDHPELTSPTGEFRDPVSAGRLVGADGTFFYPYAGYIQAMGKTTSQIRGEIAQGLARVVTSPQVDVRVIAYRAHRIQVTGAVRQPGVVTLDDTSKGLLDALGERGGVLETGSQRRVTLTRDQKRFEIDLAALMAGDPQAPNVPLRGGDVINIPDRSQDAVYVLGEVPTPGVAYLQQGLNSLTEILAGKGGLAATRANDSGILVFRRGTVAGDYPTVFALNMSNPLGIFLAGEFVVQPRDVVYVKATAFAQYNLLISEMLPTVSAIFQIDRLTDNR